MRLGTILVAGFSVFALTVAACGGDDGGGSSSTGGSSAGGSSAGGSGGSSAGGTSSGGGGGCDPTGGGGTTCKEYTDCAQQKCDSAYQDCLGAGYKSGNFAGGKCETYMKCVSACNCDTACTQKCQMDSTCQGCMTGTLAQCVTSNCSAELQKCGGGTGGGTGTGGASGGGTCNDLQACCNKLSGSDKTQCDTMYNQVKVGGDMACNNVLQTYKNSGKC